MIFFDNDKKEILDSFINITRAQLGSLDKDVFDRTEFLHKRFLQSFELIHGSHASKMVVKLMIYKAVAEGFNTSSSVPNFLPLITGEISQWAFKHFNYAMLSDKVIEALTTSRNVYFRRASGDFSGGFFSLFHQFSRYVPGKSFTKSSYRNFLTFFLNSCVAEIGRIEGDCVEELTSKTNLLSFQSVRVGIRETFSEIFNTGRWEEGLNEGECSFVKEMALKKSRAQKNWNDQLNDSYEVLKVLQDRGHDISMSAIEVAGLVSSCDRHYYSPFYQMISRMLSSLYV